ncbi:hypothetical protein [Flectobacillus major]|uniref:hypothetical protein n=1 Tax=Flectobacillus major TaxID=103 RepID=UPI0004070CF9|nr:hypothetical protein [Flectobacillus major]
MTKLISPLGERLTHFSGRIAQKYERGRFVVESLICATKKTAASAFQQTYIELSNKEVP